MVSNAVKGTLALSVKIKNSNVTFQYSTQLFLVIREKLSIPTILLGNDFLRLSKSPIIYHKDEPVSLYINEQSVDCYKGLQDNIYFTECLKNITPTLTTPAPALSTPAPTLSTPTPPQFENAQIEPTFSIFPPSQLVSFQHFSAFVASCILEKNLQAHRNEGLVKNVFAAAVYDLDQQSSDLFMNNSVIADPEPLEQNVDISYLSD